MHHRRCSLVELIASADWINHAVPSETELNVALGKLAGADLVRVYEDWTFELTDDGESLWSGPGRDLQNRLDLVVGELAVVEPGRAAVVLANGVLDAALEEYRARA